MMFCPNCGKQIDENSRFCHDCGYQLTGAVDQIPDISENVEIPTQQLGQQPVQQIIINNVQNQTSPVSIGESSKSRSVASALCIILGWLGAHRFYAGKIGTGILWLFTGGVFGIGWIIDAVIILAGEFKDSDGLKIKQW